MRKRLERQSLNHERTEHDGKRCQHDQVPIRKRREEERSRQRDDAACRTTRDARQALLVGLSIAAWMKTEHAVLDPDDRIERHVPDDAHNDHCH